MKLISARRPTGRVILPSPNGRHVAYHDFAGNLHLWDADTNGELKTWQFATKEMILWFSREGHRLAVRADDRSLHLIDVQQARKIAMLATGAAGDFRGG